MNSGDQMRPRTTPFAEGRTDVKRKGTPISGVDPRALARGIRLRRELTGSEYVKGADTDLDPALLPARELITEFVFGKIWSRKGIDHRTRSFMNIGILMALNRPHELALNLRMAVNNGLSREEIGEAILHSTAYCGVPAGVNTIAVARQLFTELDWEGAKEKHGRRKK
jgi:4-carboxymuconolactone decarboxylase